MKRNESEAYYVYCYIDPRNYEVFYYGKGTGSRSRAHLLDQGKSEKASRIGQIRLDEGEPIIRVIATDLTAEQALLVESALIWNLGNRLTNKNSGQYARKFRPHNTLHRNLEGFDFSRRTHFFNVGESDHRSWDDCRAYGFLSAGYGLKFANQVRQLHKKDVVAAYLSKYGYVGIGRVMAEAVPIRDFRIGNKSLVQMQKQLKVPKVCHDSDDLEKCEWVIGVKWLVQKNREDAIWKPGLFTTPMVRASLAKHPKTIRYIEREFGVKFDEIVE
jgi:hypothetical protein